MFRNLCSGAALATVLTSGLLGSLAGSLLETPAAHAQSACGPNSPVSTGTTVNCTVTAQSADLSCDAIPSTANHTMNVTEMSGVTVSVQSGGGNPTLLVDGPDGCFYALGNGGVAQIPGFWSNGSHRIYVGGGAGSVTLTIEAD